MLLRGTVSGKTGRDRQGHRTPISRIARFTERLRRVRFVALLRIPATGFEPVTSGLGNQRSIQLSYAGALFNGIGVGAGDQVEGDLDCGFWILDFGLKAVTGRR